LKGQTNLFLFDVCRDEWATRGWFEILVQGLNAKITRSDIFKPIMKDQVFRRNFFDRLLKKMFGPVRKEGRKEGSGRRWEKIA
jgi:hypothetical protein